MPPPCSCSFYYFFLLLFIFKGKCANSHPAAASPCGVLLLPYTRDPHGRKPHTGNLRKTLPKAASRCGAAPSLAAHTPNHHHGAFHSLGLPWGTSGAPWPGLASQPGPGPGPGRHLGAEQQHCAEPAAPGQGFTGRVWRETDTALLFVGPHTYA